MPYIFISIKGGPGSGNWGHRGIPGKVGGSSPRGAGLSPTSGKDWLQRYEKRAGKKHPSAPKEKPKPVKPKSSKYPDDYPDFQAAGKDVAGNIVNSFTRGGGFRKADVTNITRACSKLPKRHLDSVTSMEDAPYSRVQGAADSDSKGQVRLASDRRYGKMWSNSVVVHEVGHTVLYGDTSTRMRVVTLYKELVGNAGVSHGEARKLAKKTTGRPIRGFPSKYGQTNYHELFAESYEMFIANPAKLKRMAPEMYDVMIGVFSS